MATSRTGTGRWKNMRTRLIATRPNICHWCDIPIDKAAPRGAYNAIEIDHLIAVTLAPEREHDPGNLVLSCYPCNRSKGDRAAPTVSHTSSVCHMFHVSGSLKGDTLEACTIRGGYHRISA